ncbi:hypothetical protein C8R44DRAFT_725851 [Mycena epipterygia]|nr:hypothetical protein C8R44DRAFT_725851 [Mycena epipterygia]
MGPKRRCVQRGGGNWRTSAVRWESGRGPYSDRLRRSLKGHAMSAGERTHRQESGREAALRHAMSGGERPGKCCEAGIWAGFCGDEVSVGSKSKILFLIKMRGSDTLTGTPQPQWYHAAASKQFMRHYPDVIMPNRDARWRLWELFWARQQWYATHATWQMICLVHPPTLSTKPTTLPLYSNAMQTHSQRATAAPASPAAPDPPPGKCTHSSKPTPPTPLVPSTTSKPSKKGKKVLLQENPEEDLADKEPKKKKQKKTPPPLEKLQIEEPAQELPQDDNTRQTVVEATATQDLDLSQEEEQDKNTLQTVVEATTAQDLDLSQDENTLQTVVQVAAAQDLDLPPDEDEGNVETVDEDIVKAELTVLQDAASPVLHGAANTFANLRGSAGPFANSLRLVDLHELKLWKEGVQTTVPKVSRADTSSYSNTMAKQAKEDARHNGFAGTLMPVIVSEQQQDEEDFEDYIAEMARGKAKGRGKAKQTEESGEEDEDEGQGGAADDGDDEEDMGAAQDNDDNDSARASHQPWDLKSGALSDIDLKVAQAARQAYHDTLEVIARCLGKRLSAIFKAVGDHGMNHRQINPWNTFLMKHRKDHPKAIGMSKKEYAAELKAAYHDLFSSLSKDEVDDPDAHCRCVEPVMEWYKNQMATVVDTRKADGCGKALLNKAVLPFIHQSTITSNSQDIEVWGFAIDPFGDAAVIWGGMVAFATVNVTYDQAIKAKLVDMKAMFQMVNIAKRQAEANTLESENIACDARRRQIGLLFLNEIYLILGTRNEDASTLKKMSWKWADWAIQYKLHIENWPLALKLFFPSVGFRLSNIKGSHENKVFTSMCDKLRKKYQGETYDEDAARIFSWSEDKLAIEDLQEQAKIPIVSCVDGTTLLTVDKSKKYLLDLKKTYTVGNQKKKSSSSKTRKTADEDNEDKGAASTDDVRLSNAQAWPSRTAGASTAQAGSSRGNTKPVDDVHPTLKRGPPHPAKRQQLQPAPPIALVLPASLDVAAISTSTGDADLYGADEYVGDNGAGHGGDPSGRMGSQDPAARHGSPLCALTWTLEYNWLLPNLDAGIVEG